MKQSIKKITALVLCLAMLFCVSSVAYAGEKKTDCGEDCEYYPTIIVPGLGQSNTWVLDENGDFILDDEGNKISSFPAYIQVPELIKTAAVPLLLSLITQKDIGLSKALSSAIYDCFSINACDNNAQPSERVFVEKYPYPFSEYSESDYEEVCSHIPFNKYSTDLPYDHLYYFAYNSFDNHIDLVDELYEFIKLVKEQTGHEIINLVPISQGGTIANGLFEYYPDVMDCLHKVIYIVPALDGSTIIGDVFNDRITFTDAEYLYNGFLGESRLLDEGTARLIEVVARILPDEVFTTALRAAVKTLVEDVMIKSTSMWALCPSGDYPTAAGLRLSTPEMASIKEQTERYYQAQLNSDANIQKLLDKGVQVFDVVEYDYALINVGESWNTENGDYIIQTDSTSMGAYFANCGETLPEDYVQKNTHCSNPDHNHISPDRVVDASAGLLPDTTFYFDGQRHDLTQHNDVIIKLAFNLIASDDIKDVYSSPEFPQFLNGRDVRNLEALLEQAEKVYAADLDPELAKELADAVAQGYAVLDNNTAPAGAFEEAEDAIRDCLVEAGVLEAEEEKEDKFGPLSLWLFDVYGANGYSEMPGLSLTIIINAINDAIAFLLKI